MRTHTIKIFKFNELSESAQAKAIQEYKNKNYEITWTDELLQSFTKVYKTANIKLLDYALSPDFTSYVEIDLYKYDPVYNFTGSRALAWLENNFLSKLRVTRNEYLKNRKSNFGYGYRVGKIKDCPLTGYCADDDFIACLIDSINSGDCLGDSFTHRLVEKYCELLQNEYEWQNSNEYITEHFECNDCEFLECGEMCDFPPQEKYTLLNTPNGTQFETIGMIRIPCTNALMFPEK